jgi:hypothetical protein
MQRTVHLVDDAEKEEKHKDGNPWAVVKPASSSTITTTFASSSSSSRWWWWWHPYDLRGVPSVSL